MPQLTHQPNLDLSIKHLKEFIRISGREELEFHVQELSTNKETTSKILNEHLNAIAEEFQNLPEYQATDYEKRSQLLQDILHTVSAHDADYLTYKGVNLGTAANMKLASLLSHLIKSKNL